MNWLRAIFDDGSLMPHGYCLVWNPALMWLQAASDGLIGVAYYSIPVGLVYFIMRRRDVAFGWMFTLFAAFILLCGSTHFVEIWTLWHPDYAIQGMLKAATAAVSVVAAVSLWPILPKALALPSPAQLRLANDNLSREVEQRTRAVAELAREKDFTEFLINSTSECMATIDRDQIVRVWNPAIAEFSGISAAEAVGRPVFDVQPQLLGTIYEDAIRSVMTGRERVLEDEVAVPATATSRKRWVDARYSPIHDRDGHVIGCIIFVRDVTLRHEVEDTLRQAQKMEAIGQLTGGIAHDFNNFLTAVIGNLDLIGSRLPNAPAEVERLRQSALQGAQRAATLTRQLLAFSRRQVLNPQPVDVNALVGGMSDLIRRTLGEQIVTETVLAAGLWRTFADPNQVESALLNLAINGRDAMKGAGRLTLKTANASLDEIDEREGRVSGDYVAISVADTGGGMTEEVRERAFDPFFTTKEVGQGSGLGLSQVYGFAKQSGGHVKIDSQVGRGTVVTLYLPRRYEEEDALDAITDPSAAAPLARPGERLLVVEDETVVRDFTADALSDLGYEVVAVPDAAAAAFHIDSGRSFDLLITDLGLPGLDGRQLGALARRRWPMLRILYVTGYDRTRIIEEEVHEPGTDLLTKPFDSRILGHKVRAMLDREPAEP